MLPCSTGIPVYALNYIHTHKQPFFTCENEFLHKYYPIGFIEQLEVAVTCCV